MGVKYHPCYLLVGGWPVEERNVIGTADHKRRLLVDFGGVDVENPLRACRSPALWSGRVLESRSIIGALRQA